MAVDIDVGENEAFEHGWFVATFAVMVVMAASVLAALTGVLGGGPLARAAVEVPHVRVRIGYERFVRTQTPSRLDITIDRDLGSPEAAIRLDSAFLAGRDIKDILPHPATSRVEADASPIFFHSVPPVPVS